MVDKLFSEIAEGLPQEFLQPYAAVDTDESTQDCKEQYGQNARIEHGSSRIPALQNPSRKQEGSEQKEQQCRKGRKTEPSRHVFIVRIQSSVPDGTL